MTTEHQKALDRNPKIVEQVQRSIDNPDGNIKPTSRRRDL